MWVFCCGMFRSASTLQFQITTRLVKDAQVGQPVGWIDANRFAETRRQYADYFADYSGLKVIKVHACTNEIAAEFQAGNAIGIYIFRDLRDVYASMMKQRQKSFEYLCNEGFLDTCLHNYKIWTSFPHVLISRYEEVMANLPQEVQRIARHLGIDLSQDDCESIAADYQVETQKQRIQRFREKLMVTALEPNDHREWSIITMKKAFYISITSIRQRSIAGEKIYLPWKPIELSSR